MEPGEALSAAGRIAVALAGFAGVVVAFRSGSVHDWAPIDKFRFRLLLANAILPLVFCLTGILLLTLKPVPLTIWRWCSGIAAVCLIPFGVKNTRAGFSYRTTVITGPFRYAYFAISILGTAVTLLQIYNVIILGQFWPFFATIAFQLVAGIIQFVRMILLPPHPSGSA